MKVAVFFTFDYSLKTWDLSGTIDREFRIYQEIHNKYGVEFTFFTYGDESDLKLAEKYPEFKIFPIYQKINYSNNKLFRILKSFYVPFIYKKEMLQFDVLHQHQLLGSWVVILAKIFFKKPFLLRTGYDMANFAKLDNKSNLIIQAYKILTILSIRYCNLITVSNKSDYERLQKNSSIRKEKKLFIRPNWVEVDITGLDFEKRHRNKILSVGRLESQKNFELLINEFENSKNEISFDIVGNGSLRKELIDLCKAKNVDINFLGNLLFDELINLYKNYTFFISTSKFEGNPKTILEAMGSGCIVMASDIPNHRELIKDLENGILFNLEQPNLKEKFKELSKNFQTLNELSTKAVEKIKKDNNISDLSSLMFNDYSSLID